MRIFSKRIPELTNVSKQRSNVVDDYGFKFFEVKTIIMIMVLRANFNILLWDKTLIITYSR